jgi:hypothetical protein
VILYKVVQFTKPIKRGLEVTDKLAVIKLIYTEDEEAIVTLINYGNGWEDFGINAKKRTSDYIEQTDWLNLEEAVSALPDDYIKLQKQIIQDI